MAYVITEACIDRKDASCAAVCPVDCIHPTRDEPEFHTTDQLFINPEECIDCDACFHECPVSAIYPYDQLPDEMRHFENKAVNFFASL